MKHAFENRENIKLKMSSQEYSVYQDSDSEEKNSIFILNNFTQLPGFKVFFEILIAEIELVVGEN